MIDKQLIVLKWLLILLVFLLAFLCIRFYIGPIHAY